MTSTENQPRGGQPAAGTTSPDQHPSSRPGERQSASLDDLSARLRDAEGVDRDIAMMLADNWQTLVGGLVVVLIAVWLFGELSATQDKKIGEASARFSEVQNSFSAAVRTDTEEGDAEAGEGTAAAAEELQRRAFTENVTLLEGSYDDTAYGTLAPLYLAAAALSNGKLDEADSILSKFKPIRESDSPVRLDVENVDAERMASELASLLSARVLAARGKIEEARSRASLLTVRGGFVNVEALMLLFNLSTNKSQREEARQTAAKLIKERPALAEIVRQQVAELGVALE